MEQRRPEMFQHIIDPKVALKEAKELLKKGDIKKAGETITLILSTDIQNLERMDVESMRPVVFEYHPSLWKLLAEIMKKTGNKSLHDQAKKMADLCEKKLKEISEMIRDERKVYGSEVKSWLGAAEPLYSVGLVAEALEYRREAYRLEPKDQDVSRSFLIALVNARYYDLAEKVAKKAIKSGVQDGLFNEMLAVSLVFQRKYEKAIPFLKEITRIQPNNGAVWHLLAMSYGNLGRNREAAEPLRKMIDLNHEGDYARRVLRELESVKLEVQPVPGYTFSVATGASVERSDDDSTVTQDEFVIMKSLLKQGATSEQTGEGPFGGDPNSWQFSVIENLVAKGFVVFTPKRIAYLTDKGLKRILEMSRLK